ncbi:MAG: ABC transporter substrate-binding protein, partial [Chitinophagaceae bacterium]|nr:ABC transporter substrate-binding protein [Chitinophagaceae bacterium]
IISLVPSQTELLYYFGLDKEVIGITKFCVHPQVWFKTKTRVGGTKSLNIELIKKLQPDLVIANKEENVKEQIEELANEFNVWVSDVNNREDALLMIKDVGELTHKKNKAETLVAEIKMNFSELKNTTLPAGQVGYKAPLTGSFGWEKACYLIWQKPYMTIGGDTFINDMMRHCGLQNIFADKKRYPEITIQQLSTANCQLILLPSEPYPFKQKHIDELKEILPDKKIILVDGEMFSWYGSRLLLVPEYFNNLLKSLRK